MNIGEIYYFVVLVPKEIILICFFFTLQSSENSYMNIKYPLSFCITRGLKVEAKFLSRIEIDSEIWAIIFLRCWNSKHGLLLSNHENSSSFVKFHVIILLLLSDFLDNFGRAWSFGCNSLLSSYMDTPTSIPSSSVNFLKIS